MSLLNLASTIVWDRAQNCHAWSPLQADFFVWPGCSHVPMLARLAFRTSGEATFQSVATSMSQSEICAWPPLTASTVTVISSPILKVSPTRRVRISTGSPGGWSGILSGRVGLLETTGQRNGKTDLLIRASHRLRRNELPSFERAPSAQAILRRLVQTVSSRFASFNSCW